jgi:hypothetical protein
VPSLLWLFGIFQRTATDGGHGHPPRRP